MHLYPSATANPKTRIHPWGQFVHRVLLACVLCFDPQPLLIDFCKGSHGFFAKDSLQGSTRQHVARAGCYRSLRDRHYHLSAVPVPRTVISLSKSTKSFGLPSRKYLDTQAYFLPLTSFPWHNTAADPTIKTYHTARRFYHWRPTLHIVLLCFKIIDLDPFPFMRLAGHESITALWDVPIDSEVLLSPVRVERCISRLNRTSPFGGKCKRVKWCVTCLLHAPRRRHHRHARKAHTHPWRLSVHHV